MKIADIDTPAVVVDLDRAEANMARAAAHFARLGLPLRPHVKTHKLPRFALRQQALGAIGITCQKLGEAEAMADAGLADIFLPYNILGPAKLARLRALHDRLTLSVTADSAVTVAGYAATFADPARPLPVLVECDTGAGRCGVQTPEEVLALARRIDAAPGLRFAGLMTYPPKGAPRAVHDILAAIHARFTAEGVAIERVSIGGTPDMYSPDLSPLATEYRPGTYVYSDRTQIAAGHGGVSDCALTIRATVVSRPTPDRAVIDAGSKALAADRAPVPGHGHVVEYPDAVVEKLSEEHGVVDLSACAHRPEVGDVVNVIPNHACVVTNLHDVINLCRGDSVEEIAPVTSRGKLA